MEKVKLHVKIFTLAYAVLFLSIFVTIPLLHNHSDECYTDNHSPMKECSHCPANILQMTLISASLVPLVYLVLKNSLLTELILPEKEIIPNQNLYSNFIKDRAPPSKKITLN
ncbi:hypothetical protein IT568_06050 [bacterium]|nr:hypothetical protein [bacterium]